MSTTATVAEEAPFLKFPPFPKPPLGVQIIAFEDFQPSGIHVAVIETDPAGEEYVERDGLGIPTVQLKVKHVVTDDSEKKKKKKKKKGGASAPTERKLSWWEQWAEAEELRPTIGTYSLALSGYERLVQASEDFSKNRAWPTSTAPVVGLWNIFRIYIGVLPDNPQGKKTKAIQDEEQADAPSDEEFGEARLTEENDAQEKSTTSAPPPTSTPFDVFMEEPTEQQVRMDNFLDNPEHCVKTFLSSHFRERGMIWNEIRCRDAPKLIAFFLDYLLRNHAIPQSTTPEIQLRAAYDVAKLAEKELPATFGISRALPGDLSEGFVNCWGSRRATLEVEPIPLPEGENTPNSDEANPEEENPTSLALLDDNLAANLGGIAAGSTWGTSPDDKSGGGGGWGNGDDASTWGNGNSAADVSWNASTQLGTVDVGGGLAGTGWELHQIALVELLGPTMLPLTHRPGVVEESTRRIVSVFPPVKREAGEKGVVQDGFAAVEEDLLTRFGRVILAPWGEYGTETSEIQPPSIVDKSRGAVKVLKGSKKRVEGVVEGSSVKPHDPLRDNITVLIDESAVGELVVGMGLGATWVQLVREGDGVDQAALKEKDGSLWYLEQLMKAIPSYWVE